MEKGFDGLSTEAIRLKSSCEERHYLFLIIVLEGHLSRLGNKDFTRV